MRKLLLALLSTFLVLTSWSQRSTVVFSGSVTNDLYTMLQKQGFQLLHQPDPETAIQAASKGGSVFIVSDQYPAQRVQLSDLAQQLAKKKKLKVYIEYPEALSGLTITGDTLHTQLERGVITSTVFGATLKPLSILGINDCYILPTKASNPLIILGKVAGLNRAEYGIEDVDQIPLLFQHNGMLVATTSLTNFAKGRYGPDAAWKAVWAYIIRSITGKTITDFAYWPSYIQPMYTKSETLPADAVSTSIRKGVDWFSNARFYIHPDWKENWVRYQGNGTMPVGPPVPQENALGNGMMGMLEGHASRVNSDGRQQYRYWVRADVQGEAAFALAAAGNYLKEPAYFKTASHLTDFIFYNSNLRAFERNDKKSPTYGLIGWAQTHPYVYYGDDNARAILGILGASAYMQTDAWDQQMLEAILANFRTTGKFGFRSDRIEDKAIQQNGWQYYWNREVVNPAPHFESWMWAIYLWLYEKTGYQPLLDKTKTAIRMTMEAYPDKWIWTNGIQQERARMVLPLAWLVRLENTEEHRRWLDILVQELLKNQDASGAIREELGAGKGKFGKTRSNKEYGLHEAPLIFENGDPIADMLYTSNFAYFSLNEAAHATGNAQYKEAVRKLSDFMTRIQVKSNRFKDLDGAWFRGFEYNRWEYWASNADVGWGAWNTLAGWTQSWIVATQVMTAKDQNFWDLTLQTGIKKHMPATLNLMFGKAQP
jgi:hypothetical protein